MWPFSDKYVSRPSRTIIKYLKRHNVPKEERKRLARAFLDGFEHGMNTFASKISTNTRIPLSQVEKILKKGLPISDVKIHPALDESWFGICVGYVVGILRFQPRNVLNYDVYSDYCADWIQVLKDKAEFFELVRNFAIEWLTEMEQQRGNFSDKERRNYNIIKARI